jgi:ABC-2 type transport system ATP-binding protein
MMTMRESVLKTSNLTKRYKKFTALDNVNMNVCRGDIYGLIGKNGAGKTTLMKIVTGLTDKTEGDFELFSKSGKLATDEKRRIGCLIENPAFFGGLTAYQNLKYYALQKGIIDMGQIDEALSLVNLSDVKNKKFRTFSLGMKQRLGIAFAMLDNPDLIILDEPINGLDPIGISQMRETFQKLNSERGITFMISSHILSELYTVANRFLFIDNGRVLKEITKEELDIECAKCVVLKTGDTKHCATIIEKNDIYNYKVTGTDEIHIYEETIMPAQLNRLLIENGADVTEIYESGISLEDYFKSLVEEV